MTEKLSKKAPPKKPAKRKKAKPIEVSHYYYQGNVKISRKNKKIQDALSAVGEQKCKGKYPVDLSYSGDKIHVEDNALVINFVLDNKSQYPLYPNRGVLVNYKSTVKIPEGCVCIVELDGVLVENGITSQPVIKNGELVDVMLYNCAKTVVFLNNNDFIAHIKFVRAKNIGEITEV